MKARFHQNCLSAKEVEKHSLKETKKIVWQDNKYTGNC